MIKKKSLLPKVMQTENKSEKINKSKMKKKGIEGNSRVKFDEEVFEKLASIIGSSRGYKEKIMIFKKMVIEIYLKKSNYKVVKAARMLKFTRTSLYREIGRLGIDSKGDS
jgi:DNA-binding NtrC family response regulator